PTPDGAIAEDRVVSAAGSYSATAALSSSGYWVMQMAAFKAQTLGTNTAPTISSIAAQVTNEDTPSSTIGFTVGDAETPAANLTVSGSSSIQTLVPNANIVFGGTGANRTVTLTPARSEERRVGKTLTVSDGQLSTSTGFQLTVNATNSAPTITSIPTQMSNEGTAVSTIDFTVGDAETPAANLTVSGSSSVQTLVPNANIVFGGTDANRTVTLTPAANQFGTATITLTVSDGQLSTSTGFQLTVNSVNDAPTITGIGNQTTTAGTAVGRTEEHTSELQSRVE